MVTSVSDTAHQLRRRQIETGVVDTDSKSIAGIIDTSGTA
jgi:hypothetical protein